MIFGFLSFLFIFTFFYLNGCFFLKLINDYVLRTDNKDFFLEKIILSFFFISFFSLFFNFFIGVKYLSFVLLFLISFFFPYYKKKIEKKDFKIILIFSFIFFPLSLVLPPGYDAGLYHLPHQLIIREEKIIFGLSNLHDRYGLISIMNYLKAPFWMFDRFNLVSIISCLVYVLFFYKIYFELKKNNNLYLVYLSSLITFLIWNRYGLPSYGLVDAPYAIFFLLIIFQSIDLLENKIINKQKLLLFFLTCGFCILMKPSGYVIVLLPLLIAINFHREILINLKFYLRILILPLTLILLWMIKNFINTSCLLYPISYFCFNTSWFYISNTKNVMEAVQGWSYLPINFIGGIFEIFSIFGIYFFYFFLFFFLLFFILKKLRNNNIFIISYLLFLICISFIYFLLPDLKSIYFNIERENLNFVYNIIKKEIFYLLLFYSLTFLFLYISFYENFLKFFNFPKSHKKKLIPIFFVFICIIIWLSTAPNPRFGMAYFGTVLPCIFYFFSYKTFLPLKNKFIFFSINKIIFFLILLFFTFFSIAKDIPYKNYLYYELDMPDQISKDERNYVKRNEYGYKPLRLDEDKCWIKKECFSGNYEINIAQIYFGYKIATRK
jgi:hypothetical protein